MCPPYIVHLLKSILTYLTTVLMYVLVTRVQLFVTPWTVACQAPPSREFSRQEHWSGLPFSSPGVLPDPGIKPRSPALQADSLQPNLYIHIYTQTFIPILYNIQLYTIYKNYIFIDTLHMCINIHVCMSIYVCIFIYLNL